MSVQAILSTFAAVNLASARPGDFVVDQAAGSIRQVGRASNGTNYLRPDAVGDATAALALAEDAMAEATTAASAAAAASSAAAAASTAADNAEALAERGLREFQPPPVSNGSSGQIDLDVFVRHLAGRAVVQPVEVKVYWSGGTNVTVALGPATPLANLLYKSGTGATGWAVFTTTGTGTLQIRITGDAGTSVGFVLESTCYNAAVSVLNLNIPV